MNTLLARNLLRPLRWAGVMLALALAYLAMCPATWLDAVLQGRTAGNLGMAGATGTIWRGTGTLQALLPSGEVANLAPVAWEISLGELLSLRLHITVKSSQNGTPVLDATLKPGDLRIQTARLDLPAALLGAVSPTFRSADLSGQLSAQANDVRLEAGQATGSAQVVWQGAGSGLTRVRPLGNYQLSLNGSGGGLDFHLATLGGPLDLEGTGQWNPGRKSSYTITATPTQATRKDLEPLLRMLGREVSPGSYQLALDRGMGAITK